MVILKQKAEIPAVVQLGVGSPVKRLFPPLHGAFPVCQVIILVGQHAVLLCQAEGKQALIPGILRIGRRPLMKVVIGQYGVPAVLQLCHRRPRRGAVGHRHAVKGDHRGLLLGQRGLVPGGGKQLLRRSFGRKDLFRPAAAHSHQQHGRQQNTPQFFHLVFSSLSRCSVQPGHFAGADVQLILGVLAAHNVEEGVPHLVVGKVGHDLL